MLPDGRRTSNCVEMINDNYCWHGWIGCHGADRALALSETVERDLTPIDLDHHSREALDRASSKWIQ